MLLAMVIIGDKACTKNYWVILATREVAAEELKAQDQTGRCEFISKSRIRARDVAQR